MLITPLISLAEWLPGEGVQHTIANAQVAFNVIGVAIGLCLLPFITRGLEWLIPPKAKETTTA